MDKMMDKLLDSFVKKEINIHFKSGDVMEDEVVEGIVGNTLVTSNNDVVSFIDIHHIGYVTTNLVATEPVNILQSILKQEKNNNSEDNENNNSYKGIGRRLRRYAY